MILTPNKKNLLVTAVVASLALSGCASIGPSTVTVDRFDYSSAIADS
ncbi:hypothetical protein [Pseudomonas cavernicola]|nr:hypothetical protein [Pseudomonas cavernicola]